MGIMKYEKLLFIGKSTAKGREDGLCKRLEKSRVSFSFTHEIVLSNLKKDEKR